jgi:hypothetical protein
MRPLSGIRATDRPEHLIYISKRHLFPWIKGVLDWPEYEEPFTLVKA